MEEFFSIFQGFEEAYICRNKDGTSKGYAFIMFSTAALASKARNWCVQGSPVCCCYSLLCQLIIFQVVGGRRLWVELAEKREREKVQSFEPVTMNLTRDRTNAMTARQQERLRRRKKSEWTVLKGGSLSVIEGNTCRSAPSRLNTCAAFAGSTSCLMLRTQRFLLLSLKGPSLTER
jgi:hypothetical protein